MTEGEWRSCTDVFLMTRFLRDRVSERKLRLFACAWCRRWYGALPPVGCAGVERAEAMCEGDARSGEIEQLKTRLADAIGGLNRNGDPVDPADPTVMLLWGVKMALGPLQPHDVRAFLSTAFSASMSLFWWFPLHRPHDSRNPTPARYPSPEAAKEGESAIAARLFAEVVGNPLRPVAPEPAWLTSDVLALARGIYAERAFDRMPILADALQDAGCDNADVLNHCREAGGGTGEPAGGCTVGGVTHVRGCWVVDLVLGRT